MKLLKEYSEKYGLKEVVNDYNEHRQTKENSIVFSNGWVASIVKNDGIDVYHPNGNIPNNINPTKSIRLRCAIIMDILTGIY